MSNRTGFSTSICRGSPHKHRLGVYTTIIQKREVAIAETREASRWKSQPASLLSYSVTVSVFPDSWTVDPL